MKYFEIIMGYIVLVPLAVLIIIAVIIASLWMPKESYKEYEEYLKVTE